MAQGAQTGAERHRLSSVTNRECSSGISKGRCEVRNGLHPRGTLASFDKPTGRPGAKIMGRFKRRSRRHAHRIEIQVHTIRILVSRSDPRAFEAWIWKSLFFTIFEVQVQSLVPGVVFTAHAANEAFRRRRWLRDTYFLAKIKAMRDLVHRLHRRGR